MSPKRAIIAGLAAFAVIAALLTARVAADDDDTVEVVAMFEDASPLLPGNVVKAAGVDVGTVDAIEVEDGRAAVTMRIERAALPLHADVTATITTQDLLGERFVSLDQGSADQPALEAPFVIPQSQTGRVVDLQDVLDSADTPTSEALAALITESGEALRGQGTQADKALAALVPALSQAEDLAAVLDDQNNMLGRLVDAVQPVASALATREGEEMDAMVASATELLETLVAERLALQDALHQLPSTLASARATLAEVANVADPAARTLRSLRPVTGDLEAISEELTNFANAADPALAALPPVLKEAKHLLDEAAPVVAALRPGAESLVPTADAANRLLRGALTGESLTDLMEFVKGWSLATSDYDAISHYFKAMVPLSPNALGDTAAGLVPWVPDDTAHDLPVPTAPDLDLPGRDEGTDEQHGPDDESPDPLLGGLVDGVLGGRKAESATGLTAQQEQSLVQQILGGSQ